MPNDRDDPQGKSDTDVFGIWKRWCVKPIRTPGNPTRWLHPPIYSPSLTTAEMIEAIEAAQAKPIWQTFEMTCPSSAAAP